MKLKDIKGVFGSKKGNQLKIRSRKDKSLKKKLTSSMSRKLTRMNGIICDPSKSTDLETELTLSPAITVHYTSKIVDVAKVMSVKDNTTCVLVIDDRGQLCGILTDKDIVFRVLATGMDPKRTAVHTVMTANPVTATLETAKKVAMQAIYTGAFWHIPIINDSDSSSVVKTNIIGMINLNELFGRDIVEKLQQTPSFMEFSSVPSNSEVSFANRSMYSEIDMISRYEEIRQQKLTVVLDQHEESPPEIDGKMNVSIASNIMKIYKKGAVIVCDTDTRSLLGILTTQDLILRVVAAGRYPTSTSAKSVMTPNPPVVNPNKQVSKTLQYMLDNKYKYIVIGADLKITGIVDILEVTRAALQQLQDRDEIEEDAKSRRSFSEDGSSYYETSSRLIHKSSRSSFQSFDDNDKARNINQLKANLLKEESHLPENILGNISDEEDRNEINPSTILPRDISLMNNIITETIPEIDEEKESENNRILDKLNSPSNELYDIIEDTNNITEPTTMESSEQPFIEDEIQQYNNEEIQNNLPVIEIKLDPDMDAQQQSPIETNNYDIEQNTKSNEIELNSDDQVASQDMMETDHQQVVESNKNENINEIILPDEIEDHINEIIENSVIITNQNEITKPNKDTEPNIDDNGIIVSEESKTTVDEIIESNKIKETNNNIESNEIEVNIDNNIIISSNNNEVLQNENILEDINGIKPEDLIEINNDANEYENVEINNVNEYENVVTENNLELQDINMNDDQFKDIPISVPELIVSDEDANVQIGQEQVQSSLTNDDILTNDDMEPISNIPRELAMIEESINQYNMNKLAVPSTLNNSQNIKKDVATFDALLEIEVNDEGIHNSVHCNNTYYDMDNFVVTNNNIFDDSEKEVSDEAKKLVENIINSQSDGITADEVFTENGNDNATEDDNHINNLDIIKEEEPVLIPTNEPEFISSVSNPEIKFDENQYANSSESEFTNNNLKSSDNLENNNNEIYDLSTIMPSSPPMPINNYQDKIIPTLDLNDSMEKETSSLKSHEIHGSLHSSLQDQDSFNMNHHEIASIQSHDFSRNNDFIPIRNSIHMEEDLSSTLHPTAGIDDNSKDKDDDAKSAIMETIALDSDSNIVLDHNQEQNPVIERGNLIEFQKEDEQKNKNTPKSVLEYIRQIVTPNVISHIFKYSLDKSQLDDAYSMDDNSTTMLVKRVVGGRDLYDEEERRYEDRDDSSSTALYPSQYMNTSQKRVSLSRLAATQSIIKEEDLLLKCFDQETEQIYRINYNNTSKFKDIVDTIIKKSEIEDRDTLLFGYLDEDRDFIKIETEEDFLQGIWLARKLLWGRLLIVIKRKHKPSLMNILPWSNRTAANNANNEQGNWLSNAMLIGVGIAATLAVKKISS
ncbi:hypothetical protein BCR36DRAFT_323901 [Piromyces finnis]|uniref:CBS domain-containing protein n=1 Tax=Piromyces finnis TaxID=1754191 RepID=A0A1Y1VCI5_9FUNG|nr:hypothetical protein BCR36DRAFT_323901 [Piromyces finnis]|eukprot:ORX52897.1 hypothetical protein BCR36DRAFT_323901 [Piromyces finnis]